MTGPRFAETVRAAATAWRWVPYDATTVTTAEVEIVICGPLARVHPAAAGPGRTTAQLVAEVRALAAGNGATNLIWIVADDAGPADLGDALTAQGATIGEDLAVMARPLGAAAPPGLGCDPPPVVGVPGVEVHRVDSPDQLAQAYAIDEAVLGTPARSASFRRVAAATLAEQVAAGASRSMYRFLALVDGAAVATAGLTLAGPVARLWGAAVLADHRGRGIYRALLATRLADATARGATLALTKARTATSAPLLGRVGFRPYGRERHHRLALDA